MRVAIVDDDKREQKKLEEKLEIVSDILHVRILHQKFSSGEEFLAAVKKGEIFDVVLMDIYMQEGLSGIETAALMRQNTMDNILIFVTSSDEHMAEASPYHPFDYITKPIADGEILRVMRDVAKVLSEIESYLALDAGKYTIYFYTPKSCTLRRTRIIAWCMPKRKPAGYGSPSRSLRKRWRRIRASARSTAGFW